MTTGKLYGFSHFEGVVEAYRLDRYDNLFVRVWLWVRKL